MTIQWYPGHMHKAQKEIKNALPKVDLIIEVLDARIPFSSENPLIAKLRGDKPCIKVLNKSDLADPAATKIWQQHFEQQRNMKALAVSMGEVGKIRQLPGLCAKLLPQRAAGVKKMRAMIVGIPNVGKSTLINILAGRAIAKTGNEPAVTKRQQQIQIGDDLLLFDTPGILWPKQEYENSSYRLAATGAIKDTAMDYGDVAFFAAEFLLRDYPQLLLARYQLAQLPATELEFFELIGRRRGCLAGGGRVDLTKISEAFIGDLRSGALGAITMETPAVIAGEVAAAQAAQAQRQAEKAAREQKNNQV